MPSVRRAAVAGRFYPSDPTELGAVVRTFLDEAPSPSERPPKAIIAPHAGYVYSGPIAGSAYAQLAPDRGQIERIVLLGPAHRVPVRGLAAPSVEALETPLGDVRVDRDGVDRALQLPNVFVSDRPHELEHSLEVQLPFIQVALGDVSVVPFAVGDATAAEVADVLELLWGGPETRIVVSSDLSHYLEYTAARALDERTTRAIEALDEHGLGDNSACGRVPIRGLLVEARKRGLHARVVDVRSSGDTAGPRDQVVGYGAYVFD